MSGVPTGRLSQAQRSVLVRVALPPLVGIALVVLALALDAAGIRTFSADQADTPSEAAAMGQAARVLELQASGLSLNARSRVRRGLIGPESPNIYPLEAAIVSRRVEMVRLLLRSGASQPSGARLVCLARARLPEVLPEFGAPPASSAEQPMGVSQALELCPPSG